jgi:hypothetical protein
VSDLAPALEATNSVANAGATQSDREQLQEVLQLMHLAIEQCSLRKAQITPLINTLVATKSTPDTP